MLVLASKLNVRSGPGTEFRVLGQLDRHTRVEVLERHGDWTWVRAQTFNMDGWVHAAYLESATPPKPAVSALAAPAVHMVQALFGEPCTPACSAGRVHLPAPLRVGWQNAEIQIVACHELMAPIFSAVFAEIYERVLWHLIRTYDGIYNCRSAQGLNTPSLHSYGIAIDLNAETNRMGTAGDMDPRLVAVFEKHGFYWGGRFSGARRDPMHFEFVRR